MCSGMINCQYSYSKAALTQHCGTRRQEPNFKEVTYLSVEYLAILSYNTQYTEANNRVEVHV